MAAGASNTTTSKVTDAAAIAALEACCRHLSPPDTTYAASPAKSVSAMFAKKTDRLYNPKIAQFWDRALTIHALIVTKAKNEKPSDFPSIWAIA
jgi:hypothetical protein